MPLFTTLKSAVCTTIFIFTFQAVTNAQEKTLVRKAWIEISGGPASMNGSIAKVGVKAIFKDKWIGSISYYSAGMDLKGMPANYDPGDVSIGDILIGKSTPSQHLQITNITAGKFATMGRSVFFSGYAGLSIVKGNKATFTSQPVTTRNNWLYTSTNSNYDVKMNHKTVAGGIIESDIMWAFSASVGMGIGGFANINSIQSHVGAEFKLVAGWMHKGKKNKP